MSETTKTPWHLWAVGGVGVLWNAYGCYDYFMTQTGGEAYLRDFGMNEAQIAYFYEMPSWMTAVWAIGVWGAMLGALLLLLRNKLALPVFIASLAAYVLSLVYNYLLSDGAAVMGDMEGMWIMQIVILAACIFFVWYAWFATKRGVLR